MTASALQRRCRGSIRSSNFSERSRSRTRGRLRVEPPALPHALDGAAGLEKRPRQGVPVLVVAAIDRDRLVVGANRRAELTAALQPTTLTEADLRVVGIEIGQPPEIRRRAPDVAGARVAEPAQPEHGALSLRWQGLDVEPVQCGGAFLEPVCRVERPAQVDPGGDIVWLELERLPEQRGGPVEVSGLEGGNALVVARERRCGHKRCAGRKGDVTDAFHGPTVAGPLRPPDAGRKALDRRICREPLTVLATDRVTMRVPARTESGSRRRRNAGRRRRRGEGEAGRRARSSRRCRR